MDNSKRLNITAALHKATVDWQMVLSDSIAYFGCSTGTLHFLEKDSKVLKLKARQGNQSRRVDCGTFTT